MVTYKGKKYKNINELAKKLKVSFRMANHLYHVNGGTTTDENLLKNKETGGFIVKKVDKPIENKKKPDDLDDIIDEILEDGEDGRLKKESVDKIKDIKNK